MPLTFPPAMLLVVPARKTTAARTITFIKVVNFRIVFPLFVYRLISRRTLLQPGDLRVLRGVVRGFSEEARTRGFPSLALARFAIVVVVTKHNRRLRACLIGNIISENSSDGNVRCGSLAAPRDSIISAAAIGGKADVKNVGNT